MAGVGNTDGGQCVDARIDTCWVGRLVYQRSGADISCADSRLLL